MVYNCMLSIASLSLGFASLPWVLGENQTGNQTGSGLWNGTECQDISEASDELEAAQNSANLSNLTAAEGVAVMKCASAVRWAKKTGIAYYPSWYPGITENSSLADFQCVLFLMKGGGSHNGVSHHCHKPCTSTMSECPRPTPAPTPMPTPAPPAPPPKIAEIPETTAAPVEEKEASISLLTCIFIGLLILLSIGAVVGYQKCTRTKTEKKTRNKVPKRSLAEPSPPVVAPTPEPTAMAAPLVGQLQTHLPMTAATPIQVATLATSTPGSMGPPILLNQVQTMQTMGGAPVPTYAAPVPTYAAPLPVYSQGGPSGSVAIQYQPSPITGV